MGGWLTDPLPPVAYHLAVFACKDRVQRMKWKKLGKMSTILFGLLLLAVWWMGTPEGLLGKADAVGYAVCHRIPSHSFSFLKGRPFSLCARCTGQYLGVVLGLVYLVIAAGKRGGNPPWLVTGVLVGSFLAYGVDGLNSLAHVSPRLEQYALYTPRNELRLLSGLGMGISISVLVYLLFQRTVWQRYVKRPVLSGVAEWGGLYLLAGVLALAVLSGDSRLLVPLSLVSALGVILLLTVLYGLIWMILLEKEGSYTAYRELGWLLLAGSITALAQIGGMDLLRFWITGTWSGFHLG